MINARRKGRRVSLLATVAASGATEAESTARGSVTVKRLPWPGSLSSVTPPPCNSTSFATSASPSPVPSWARLKPESICVNA